MIWSKSTLDELRYQLTGQRPAHKPAEEGQHWVTYLA